MGNCGTKWEGGLASEIQIPSYVLLPSPHHNIKPTDLDLNTLKA